MKIGTHEEEVARFWDIFTVIRPKWERRIQERLERWKGTPLGWLKFPGIKTVGTVQEIATREFFGGRKTGSSDSDMAIGQTLYEIKAGFEDYQGYVSANQIRTDQLYNRFVIVALLPDDIRCWVLEKDDLVGVSSPMHARSERIRRWSFTVTDPPWPLTGDGNLPDALRITGGEAVLVRDDSPRPGRLFGCC